MQSYVAEQKVIDWQVNVWTLHAFSHASPSAWSELPKHIHSERQMVASSEDCLEVIFSAEILTSFNCFYSLPR